MLLWYRCQSVRAENGDRQKRIAFSTCFQPATKSRVSLQKTMSNNFDLVINCGQYCNIKFKMLKKLAEFVAVLHKNNVSDKHLQGCVRTHVHGEDVTISLELPDEGQYGLDLYTRDANQPLIEGKQLLTHCCKYLINCRV